jgi:hypothetical protein
LSKKQPMLFTIWERQNGENYMEMTKKNLDLLMKEYNWDKNTLEDNVHFLAYMYDNYDKLYRKQLMEEQNA